MTVFLGTNTRAARQQLGPWGATNLGEAGIGEEAEALVQESLRTKLY